MTESSDSGSTIIPYLINGAAVLVTGGVAVLTLGALVMRKKLKPKNSWNNTKTLEGLNIVITGGNSGIGAATVQALVERKANVTIASRSRDSSVKFIEETHARFPLSQTVKYKHLDLSSLQNVREFVDTLPNESVDILINNAAIWGNPELASKEDLEQTFATNYLAPFYLTKLMLEKYSMIKRVINVSSGLHTKGKIDPEDLESLIQVPSEMDSISARQLYSTSKLANVYHSSELAERHPQLTAVSMHPGLCYTSLARYIKPKSIILSWLGMLLPLIIRTAEEGARTTVYCCVEEGIVSGGFYGDCAKEELTEAATNPEVQKKLWQFSEKVLSEKLSTKS